MSKIEDATRSVATRFPALDRNNDQKVDVGDVAHGAGEIIDELESRATNWWYATVAIACGFIAGCAVTYFLLCGG